MKYVQPLGSQDHMHTSVWEGKKSAWQAWPAHEDITDTFLATHTFEHLNVDFWSLPEN